MGRQDQQGNPCTGIENLAYLEQMYERYRENKRSLPREWLTFFNGDDQEAPQKVPDRRSIQTSSGTGHRADGKPRAEGSGRADASAQERLNRLIRCYRVRGHEVARVNPLGTRPPTPPELDPMFFGFREEDFDRQFWCESLFWPGPLTLHEILARLRATYCRHIGVQYMHIADLRVRSWLQERMERNQNRIDLSRRMQLRIFTRLTNAVIFEEFLRKRFLGAKTFSLEGCESLIPLLDLAIEKAGAQGVREIVLGMAHRGRLNVLANVIGKPASHIFHEFADDEPERYVGGGDVKYHLGHSNDWKTSTGARVHLSLSFNPSHLEFVNPIALGRVRAKQDRVRDEDRDLCMALLIHGDAAFAGEGIVQETLNLSQLNAYATGGTLHVIVNNQIGFTTPPSEGRSSRYATDVARMLQVPIFHVNGEAPEAVAQCLDVAMDFRKQFKRDVFIDMYGYRKLGHNESDEPSFTQPALYRAIDERPSVQESYLESLLDLNGITRDEANRIAAKRREHLERELSQARKEDYHPPGERLRGVWARSRFHGGSASGVQSVRTNVELSRLKELLGNLTDLPEDFKPHPKIERFRHHWRQIAEGERRVDWSAAEALALATLGTEGVRVRFSGQDSPRGTFSQRHAVLHDHTGKGSFMALQHLASDQAPVEIFNSPLSEAGVLGFEYGYSLEYPDALVLWEAQFGDFVNAAQVIVDQFIASAEDKWRRLSGIVLLLPHGFEGMGPEHSSARLERFLSLCAEDNIQVAYPSTPAQYFHILRRQALRLWRKPLVLMTPKSMLRRSECSSSLEELTEGAFQIILPDPMPVKKPRRILLCAGKLFYELVEHREEAGHDDVAVVRLEEFYPWHMKLLEQALEAYPEQTPVVWVQEEPENMGAWPFLRLRLGQSVGGRWPLDGVSRPESASPATGSASAHKLEQKRLLEKAFAPD